MNKSKVFFVSLKGTSSSELMAKSAARLWEEMGGEKIVAKNSLVAIKQHFGEEGSPNYVPPLVTRVIGECVKKAGGKPFVTDSNTLYNGKRANAVDHLEVARKHGFSHEVLGFPVIIADGLKGESQLTIDGKWNLLKKIFLAGAASMADASVVLTHVTGHMLTGMGASIKNVAMGCAGRAGKLQQHHSAAPIFSRAKCKACGKCAKHCPANAIEVKEYAILNSAKCIGCGECYAFCPYGAVSFEWSETSTAIQKKMAEYCMAFHEEKDGRVVYFNFITKITKNCDCLGKKENVLPDVGIAASFDPVAVDKASFDLLNKREGKNIFMEFWPQHNPLIQLEHAEKIGLGSMTYDLVEV